MSETIPGGRFRTASGVFVNANGDVLVEADDLTVISGINSTRAKKLNGLGISTYKQLIDADVSALVADVGVTQRTITKWQKEAKTL